MIIDESLVRSMTPNRPDDGHKGTFGTALIVAGSEFMSGAQVLATSACLNSGVGMVRVLAPEASYAGTRVNCPCAMLSPYPDNVEALLREASEFLGKCKAVLVGPGIDVDDKRSYALLWFFIQNAPALVIDASALTLLAKYQEELLPLLRQRTANGLSQAILTPHIGEMRRLSDDTSVDAVKAWAKKNNCVVVLKNAETNIITPEEEVYTNIVTNSGMAKGGSGDVLSGLMTGLLAQGIDAVSSAVSAVFFHSLAGGIAASDIGKRAMLPTDIIDNLSYAYETVGWK